MELEEQQRREMVERHKEDMIRESAAATGQSAQMLRAIHRRAYNAPTDSWIGARRDDIDVLAQYVVDDMAVEQNRRYCDRTGITQARAGRQNQNI